MSESLKLYMDLRWLGGHGIGRFAQEINARLNIEDAHLAKHPTHPLDTFVVSAWLMKRRLALLFSPGYNAPTIGLSRYAFVVHDLNHVDMPHNSGLLKRIYYRLVLKRACRKAAAVLTVSHFTAKRISDWSGLSLDKIKVVGNGVSAAFTATVDKHAEALPYFFVVGNRKGHKNERRVLQAYAAMPSSASALLVFSGQPSNDLVELAQTLAVADRIRFTGRLEEEQLASYYAGAVAVVFPSLYEGFGLPVVEAMACGTPVITSTTTSLPEVAGNAAILVNPESVEEITAAMVRISNDAELVHTLRERGFTQAAKFSWDDVARRVQDALQQVKR